MLQPSAFINTEGLDGYYLDESAQTLYLFQCTVSDRHPVNAMGIIKAVRQLNAVNSRVILVFVLPDPNPTFSRQAIQARYSDAVNPSSDVIAIHGVGTTLQRDLHARNIKTIDDLEAAVLRGGVPSRFVDLFKRYQEDRQLQVDMASVHQVPQFKLELPNFT